MFNVNEYRFIWLNIVMKQAIKRMITSFAEWFITKRFKYIIHWTDNCEFYKSDKSLYFNNVIRISTEYKQLFYDEYGKNGVNAFCIVQSGYFAKANVFLMICFHLINRFKSISREI